MQNQTKKNKNDKKKLMRIHHSQTHVHIHVQRVFQCSSKARHGSRNKFIKNSLLACSQRPADAQALRAAPRTMQFLCLVPLGFEAAALRVGQDLSVSDSSLC